MTCPGRQNGLVLGADDGSRDLKVGFVTLTGDPVGWDPEPLSTSYIPRPTPARLPQVGVDCT
jgi:hypothetical protein